MWGAKSDFRNESAWSKNKQTRLDFLDSGGGVEELRIRKLDVQKYKKCEKIVQISIVYDF